VTVNASGAVDGWRDYYPYGMTMEQRSGVGSADRRYQFTGHEKDALTGLTYAGARTYLTEEGIWMQVDPLADQYPGWSPYNYVLGNSLRYVDPDGGYVKAAVGGTAVYRRWTSGDVQANLTFSKMPIVGTYFLAERALRNDPSFRPNFGDYFMFGYNQAANLASAYYGIGLLGIVNEAVVNIATSEITKEQGIEMRAEQLAFGELVEKGEAVYVTYVKGRPVATKNDTGIIMMDPNLKRSLLENNRLRTIENWFENLIEDTKKEHLKRLQKESEEKEQ
jgi:RHS repeat-associated protein